MPPATPSPHRFVSGQQRQASPTKKPKPPSALRPHVSGDAFEPGPTQRAAPSSQFASAPRFSAGKAKPSAAISRPASPPEPALVSAWRATARQSEDVVDAPPEADRDEEEMLDDEQVQALPTTEHRQAGDSEWANDLPYSPKRRRMDGLGSDEHNGMTTSSPARPSFRHLQTPALQLPKTPRFAHPQSSHSNTIAEVVSQHRPPFLRPSVAAQEPSEPLPEAFSPHRRGQKFVPGGMAATVQQWVIETGQAAVQSRRGQAYLRGDDFAMRVKVEDVKGDGPFLALARTANGEAVNVLLTRSAIGAGPRAAEVREGDVVGIRAPTWNTQTDGRSWAVGVDWKVIS
ncbi:hypothetical protein LTR36_010953 [Oleoguttula mirabilis]|uniref:Uncharacterized protein n=1 Tax=Oleoguttula mirabilis TaxID=1507867 RepID=A0AAV9J3G0_9PEZI|nr:hypothetical protein LTR36_010953 [Oleoguttula mirabilis]